MRLALALLLVACAPPSQHDPDAYAPPVTVAFGQSLDGITAWRADQRPYLTDAVAAMNRLGPAVSEADESIATFVFRTFDSAGKSGVRCHLGAGRTIAGSATAEIDPACCDGYPALERALVHEFMHMLTWNRWHWVGHICQHPGDAPDCHGSIFGVAVMNPALGYLDDGPQVDSVWTPSDPNASPTQLDLDLIARCRERGACQ